jgi:hypothetical protein
MADDNPLKTIQGVLNLTDDERKLIQGGNAAKLFKLSKR